MLVELRAENYAVIDHAMCGLRAGAEPADRRDRSGEVDPGRTPLALLMGGKASAEVGAARRGGRPFVACVFEATAGAEAILKKTGSTPEGQRHYFCAGRFCPRARAACL